jgi:hypothetical protein
MTSKSLALGDAGLLAAGVSASLGVAVSFFSEGVGSVGTLGVGVGSAKWLSIAEKKSGALDDGEGVEGAAGVGAGVGVGAGLGVGAGVGDDMITF